MVNGRAQSHTLGRGPQDPQPHLNNFEVFTALSFYLHVVINSENSYICLESSVLLSEEMSNTWQDPL